MTWFEPGWQFSASWASERVLTRSSVACGEKGAAVSSRAFASQLRRRTKTTRLATGATTLHANQLHDVCTLQMHVIMP